MSNRNQLIWIALGLLGLMSVTLFFGFRQHPTPFDDAYITYRYAHNIALGRGFVYNVGEPVLGTTTPLYTLLLAGLSLVWPNLPLLSHVIGVLAWTICVPITYGIGQTGGRKAVGFMAATFIALNPLFLNVLGMETSSYVLLVLLTFFFFLKDQPLWAALFAGLAFLMRWDGILVVAVFLFAEMLKSRRTFLRASLICACIIVPWLVYSYLTFGSIFPNSFFAKAGQGWNQDLGGAEIGTFGRGLLSIASGLFAQNRLFMLFPLFALLGLFSAYRHKVKWWPLLLWTAAYFAGYVVLGVLRFEWYYPPLVPAFALLTAEGIDAAADFAAKRLGSRARNVVLAALTLLCLIPSAGWLINSKRTAISDYAATYMQVGAWLQTNTPPDSSVAMIEIGMIGFYSDRTVVDTMGLVSPEMIGHLEGWLQTLQFALNYYWPDYVVALERTAWEGIVNEPWFEEAYVFETRIASSVKPVTIYRRLEAFPPREFALDSQREVWFDEILALRDFQLVEDQVEPGSKLHVQLNWEAQSNVDDDYHLNFELLNASDGQLMTIASDLRPMRQGNPTYQWLEGDKYFDSHTLLIADDVPSGQYLLRLIVTGQDGPVPVSDSQNASLNQIAVGPLQIGTGLPDTRELVYPMAVTFAENINLLGYDVETAPDNSLLVTLFWQATAEIAEDYTIFVHLLSPEGELVAQSDSPPLLPTSSWLPSIPVTDVHSLALPADYLANDYQILVGLYHWPDLERVPLLTADCVDAENDAISVGKISFDDEQATAVQTCTNNP
jgi:hypothetical protein